jgi:hypothetical protein
MLAGTTTDPVSVGSHHSSPQLMEDAECRLVARQSKLPLELDGRHALRLTGDQIGRPEPSAEGRMATLHDGADQKAGLATTGTALQDAGSIGDAERFADDTAMQADEAVHPAGALKIGRARHVIGKKPLEFGKGLRKGQIVPLVNVHVGQY